MAEVLISSLNQLDGLTTVTSFRLWLARSFAAAYRFQGLRVANLCFGGFTKCTIAQRAFFEMQMYVDLSRSNAHRLIYLEGERFVSERFLLTSLVQPGASVVDIGANIGYYALMFSHLVGRHGRIICIEPEPNNLIELVRNVESNKLENVEVFPVAVGNTKGSIGLSSGVSARVADRGDEEIRVDVLPLGEVIRERAVDFIKIDVEGFEGQVLDGAEDVLSKQRPRLFVEIHPALLVGGYTVAQIINALGRLYRDIRFYEPRERGIGEKVRTRYSRRPMPCQLSLAAVMSRTDVFWAICR